MNQSRRPRNPESTQPYRRAAVLHRLRSLALGLLCLMVLPDALAQEDPAEAPITEGTGAATTAVPEASDLFARDSYRLDPIICPFKSQIDYEPGDIECGLLEVPENREDPASRFIELHVVKLNSRWGRDDDGAQAEESGLAPGKRSDPVVYLTGGPGAPATYYVERFKDHGLLDHRDLYILEQRGIGASDDFCPFYSARKPADDDVATFDESVEAGLKDQIDCATNARAAGVDLAGYNTIENARDVKALRRALGFESWNVWGISYGSILGQAYIKEDPEGIRAVALDAIMPLSIHDAELYWRVVHWYDRVLSKLQGICDQQPDCAETYPDIGGRLRSAVASVVDDPIVVEVKDTELFPSGKARIFQDIVALLPFTFFYEQANYPALPGLIYAWADAVERRDEDLFTAIASFSGGGFGDSSEGMRNAILCIDGDVEAQGRASRQDMADYPILGQALGSEEALDRALTLCGQLGMAMRPRSEYEAVQTDLPTLIIEGDMDPITPPPNARAILPGFSNGTYVEFPYAGHGPSRSVECAGEMLNRFYDDPTARPDLSCAESMTTPTIYVPFYTTRVVPALAARFAQDKRALIGPAIWLAVPLMICLVAFPVLTFAPVLRLLDQRKAPRTGGARPFVWLTAGMALAAICILGAAAAATSEQSELLLIFGLVPWARYGAWCGLAAGLFGLLAVYLTVRSRRHFPPFSTQLGFHLTGLAGLALSAFLITWDLTPW